LESGINLFRARIKTPLAQKGQLLAIPADRMIHSYVLNYGQWGKKEANYLTKVLESSLKKHPNDTTLVDFGAHAGFVSKQVLDKLKSSRVKAILVDALTSNLSAQVFNLSAHIGRISLITSAVSDVSGPTKFLMDMDNVGGSHMKGNISPTLSEVEYDVQSMTPAEFEMQYLQTGAKFVVKSDIEGWDAYVLGGLSSKIWNNIIGGVIEVETGLNPQSAHTLNLKESLSEFELFWDPSSKEQISIGSLFEFWTGDSREVRNLYFRRL
jgi:FkbM family methyltransferase